MAPCSHYTLVHAPVRTPAIPPRPRPHALARPPAASGPRQFVEEKHVLRREEKQDVPGWLWGTAYVVVGALFASLFAAVAAGYSVAGGTGPGGSGGSGPTGRAPRAARRLVGAGA